MAQSSNPVLARGFGQGQHASWNTAPAPSAGDLNDMYNRPAYAPPARFMTLDDVVLRTAATLGVVVVTGAVTWIANLQGLAIIGALVGFVLALVISFKQSTNPALILTYAAAEGVFLGAISRVFNDAFGGGIVIQAVVGTAGVFAGMLVVYKTGAIRVTPEVHPLAARRADRRRGAVAGQPDRLAVHAGRPRPAGRVQPGAGDRLQPAVHRHRRVHVPARLRHDRQGHPAGRARSASPGTRPSASRSPWSGSTWRSSGCSATSETRRTRPRGPHP